MKTMPLAGIKIVELTRAVAGPVAGAVLTEWGAEVIKIENPKQGDSIRNLVSSGVIDKMDINPYLELGNHNKRGVCLDLKQEAGREVAYKLVEQADIFITNYRPKALEDLGMDYETLSRINPRLIYAQNTGYGLKGVERDKPAYDDTAFWARGGYLSILGEPDAVPSPLRGAQGDMPTALGLVCGILLALLHREQTGLGQRVDISLIGTGVWGNAGDILSTLISGRDVPRVSRKVKPNPLVNIYETKDHRWLQLAMPQTDPYWPGICRSIGRDDLTDDPRFDTHEKRRQNNIDLISILDEAIAKKTLGELEAKFIEEDIVYALGKTCAEIANDPQVSENEYIRDMGYPSASRPVQMVVCPVKLSNIPKLNITLAPEMGQHTEEVLLELGYSWDEISELKKHEVIM